MLAKLPAGQSRHLGGQSLTEIDALAITQFASDSSMFHFQCHARTMLLWEHTAQQAKGTANLGLLSEPLFPLP